MSEPNPPSNSTAVQSSCKSWLLAVVVVSGLLVALSLAAGFLLGRHESSRAAGPATQPALSAADIANQDEAAEKANYQRVGKLIGLLDRERNLLELELNEDVLKKLAEKELALGGDQINTFQQWNGKQFQLQRLIENRMQVLSEVAGAHSRLDSLARDLNEGRTPPEIEVQVRNNARYLEMQHYADEMSRLVDELKSSSDPDAESVKAAERRHDAAIAKLDEVHEELKSTLTDALNAHLESELAAADANLKWIDEYIVVTGNELGALNQTMADYQVLQQREKRLRQRLDVLSDRISELRMFDLQGVPTPDFLRTSWPRADSQ
jgi:hypothetical protein